MKKTFFNFWLLVSLGFATAMFTSCDDDKEDSVKGTSTVYYAEAFTVIQSSADLITNSIPSNANFEQLKSYRDQLKNKMDKLLYSENGLSQAEVKETFVLAGMTDSQANTAVSNLNDRGNNLLKGTYTLNTSYYIFWYFEKRKK